MVILFRLDVPLMSKARPRFGNGRSYMPSAYREWKDRTRKILRFFWEENNYPTLTNMELHVTAHGPGRADGDNLIGSLLDSGLPDKKTGFAGCWTDDRVTVIPVINFRWIRSKANFYDVMIISPAQTTP